MNVELLAKMIGQLVVDYDKVSLPGVGTFYVELMPASFSDKGFSMNPPYKTLSFNQVQTDDSLLVDLYAQANNLQDEVARPYIVQFLQELKQVLIEKKTIILPGLGKLRATRENNFFFVCDEKLDIFPEGFALKPISLKSLAGMEIEPINIQVPLPPVPGEPAIELPAEPEQTVISESAPEPVPESEPETEVITEVEPETEPAPAPAPEAEQIIDEPRKQFRWWILVLVLFALAAIALAAFLVLAQVAPDFIDSILYTPEELRIIYY